MYKRQDQDGEIVDQTWWNYTWDEELEGWQLKAMNVESSNDGQEWEYCLFHSDGSLKTRIPAEIDGKPVVSLYEFFMNSPLTRCPEPFSYTHLTYCDGHPEPEYIEVPEPEEDELTGEVTNEDEIEAAEELNAMLEAQWEELIALCEEKAEDGTHFHSMDSGEALEQMKEDRQSTYESFINLEYSYTVKEVTARYGYTLHGIHNDDEKIPVIRITSSEAGSDCQIISTSGRELPISGDAHTYRSLRGRSPAWKSPTASLFIPEPRCV